MLLLLSAPTLAEFFSSNSILAQTWIPTSAPTTNWQAVASSADGNKLAATVYFGPIYTSTNSGFTWSIANAPCTNWVSVASSADGTKLVAAVGPGGVFGNPPGPAGLIYLSSDSGATWRPSTAPVTNWSAVVCSGDGSRMVAVIGGSAFGSSAGGPPGPIFISHDSGTNWTSTAVESANCTAVASSADGRKIIALEFGGPFFTSRDAGETWVVSNYLAYVISVASSADGSRWVSGTADPFHNFGAAFYASTNCGATWNLTGTGGSPGRTSVASSADGEKLVAAQPGRSGAGGPIITSTNGGATWVENDVPRAIWSSLGSSADGSKLIAAGCSLNDFRAGRKFQYESSAVDGCPGKPNIKSRKPAISRHRAAKQRPFLPTEALRKLTNRERLPFFSFY
jgi:hypothetical protein